MAGKGQYIYIRLKDEAMFEKMQVVLDFEAARRGVSRSQAFASIVMEAADIEAYPEPVRAALVARRAEREAEASVSSLEWSGLGETA